MEETRDSRKEIWLRLSFNETCEGRNNFAKFARSEKTSGDGFEKFVFLSKRL